MKKTLTILSVLALGAVVSFGQGTIAVYNAATSAYYVSTNNISGNAPGSQTIGVTTGANQYYYALLISSTPLADSPSASGWTIAQINGGGGNFTITNYLNGGMRGSAGTAGQAIAGWAASPGPAYSNGALTYYMLMGWSANLGGSGAAQTILNDYTANSWATAGYFGFSAVASEYGGNPSVPLTAQELFGTGSSGTGLANGFQLLSVVTAPEPTSMALFALSGASLLLFRRKK
jgi:hypothetical protein